MKKYPFSNKAAKAMIAATIVFTPVATTAGLFNAEKVEAGYWHFNSPKTLANYSNLIHEESASQNEIDTLNTAINKISESEWKEIAKPILDEGVLDGGTREAELEVTIAIIKTYLQIQLGAATKDSIEDFIDDTKNDFGFTDEYTDSQVTAAYLTYLENIESKLYTLTGTISASRNPFVALLQAVQSANGDPLIKNKVQSTIVVNEETAAEAAGEFFNILITKLPGSDLTAKEITIQNALIGAYLGWQLAYEVGKPSGGGGVVVPTPEPGPVVEVPSTPGDPVEVTPVVEEGATEVVVTIPAALQAEIVTATPADTTEIVINVPESTDDRTVVLDLPASLAAAIQAKAPAADIVIDAGGIKYILPLSQVDLSALAAGLGGNLTGVTLRINIDQLTSAQTNSLENRIQAKAAGTQAASSETKAAAIEGAIEVKAPAVEVKVELVKDNAVVSELKSFGDVYVEQEFTIDGTVNTNKATGVVVAADGSFKALPTKFKTEGGKQIAVVSTLASTGGVSTVIEASVTFPDVNKGKNWAEKEIEALASKFIISGTTAGTYKPDQEMTRSQFAFLLSRALGLPGTTAYDKRFSDVKGDEWFNANGEFMAAVKYGVISGKPNGTFAPNDKVTRAEAAAMIGRALELDFINFDEKQLDKKKKLANFKDAKEIGASTRAEVLKVYQAGIMSGASNGEFNPNDYTKRDQMARILAQFLVKANLMDSIK
ncbi:S-layer homology domain-containing protein [Domibacillus sp. A3M-37]|uniref:S-layer homology domain-containing protein n=1 Tax=Domibacillus sp. A3M-37 TaxID=2962037 RepID=UPI0020B8660D|nr:S-layer homology domain-containing protein [Domibacillus sp. A3M-37]MCP3761415.1 S-layer homology domain-containing protein [Domibacillus sp. A3M-37]